MRVEQMVFGARKVDVSPGGVLIYDDDGPLIRVVRERSKKAFEITWSDGHGEPVTETFELLMDAFWAYQHAQEAREYYEKRASRADNVENA